MNPQSSLRQLFDEIVELPPDSRHARIDALDVTVETRAQLRVMVQFEGVIQHPPERRDEKLAGLSLADRSRLQSMLTAHEKVPALMQAAAIEASRRLDNGNDKELGQSLVDTTIGTFRLLAVIGQGGSSAVFRAVRAAGDGSQFVALKVLRTGLYSADAQRRFRREQSILAKLTHPNIASFIEGGISDAGIPYIAMELVDGVAIDRAADERGLNLDQRLKLFCSLCRTIEAAHASLIVHMDLKPSNLLVTRDGDLKVLDFGIAKLVDHESGASRTQSVALTPGYAAPEQYGSEPLTTAIDVYALGIVLTELLTGQKGASGLKPSALLGLAATADTGVPRGMPARPILMRLLRGELDDIVLRAVADEPQLRYRTAGALADDVERYLAGEPVRAHPPSRWYRARKFLRRHRIGLALTTVLVVSISASLGAVVWQARNLAREVQRADTIRDFLEDMFAPIEAGMINDKQASVRDLLASATHKLGGDATLGDAARIDLQLLFSRLHERMNNSDTAQALANDAAGLATSKLAVDDPLRLDAEISRAYTLLELGKQKEAEPLFSALQARGGVERIVHGPPLIRLYDGLAEMANARNNHAADVDYERKALAERIAVYGDESQKAAIGYANLATSLNFSEDRLDEAIEAYEHAYKIDLAKLGPDSFFTAFFRRNLSVAQLMAGRLRAAHEGMLAIEPVVEAPPNNRRDTNVLYWEGRCQLATEIGAPKDDGACDRVMRAAKEILGPGNLALKVSSQRMRTQWDIDRGELAAARIGIERIRALVSDSGNGVWVGTQGYLSGLVDLASGDNASAAGHFSGAIRNLGHPYPAHMRLNALSLRAMTCSQNERVSADSCPGDAEPQARNELDAQFLRWHPRLLPAHIALARLDLQHGQAAVAATRLRDAIEHARKEVDPSQVHLVEARLWLIVAEARGGDCVNATADAATVATLPGQDSLRQHPVLAAARSQLRGVSGCELTAE